MKKLDYKDFEWLTNFKKTLRLETMNYNCYWVRYKDSANRVNKTVRVVACSSVEAVAYFKKKNPKCEVLKCSLDFIGMDKELLDKWNDIIHKWTGIAMTYDEIKRFLNYAVLHKNELIKHLEELDIKAGE